MIRNAPFRRPKKTDHEAAQKMKPTPKAEEKTSIEGRSDDSPAAPLNHSSSEDPRTCSPKTAQTSDDSLATSRQSQKPPGGNKENSEGIDMSIGVMDATVPSSNPTPSVPLDGERTHEDIEGEPNDRESLENRSLPIAEGSDETANFIATPPQRLLSDEGRPSDNWMTIVRLLAAPFFDETGDWRSAVSGILCLTAVGAAIGLVSDKDESLPTPWYRSVSAMIGYTYFIFWSISFYPQVVVNFKRKSTHGLSVDFCALNTLGFLCYTIYNVCLFWSPVIRELYRERFNSEVTVHSNDVAFAIHALALSTTTVFQIFAYGGSQRLSCAFLGIILSILVIVAIALVLVICGYQTWLDFVFCLSYIKIGISFVKYIPQVILNYRRRSTSGWSIWNILLDFGGGLLSDLQLVLDCADLGDFSGITGNVAKFLLGFVSIVFDIIFMIQHYILYPDSPGSNDDSPERRALLADEESPDVL